jgi:basic amino acid/polyamine antiporter, APA family
MARPFRTPFSPVFPLIGIVLCVYLMAQLPLTTWVRFFGWLAAGALIYVFYGYRHSRLRRAAVAASHAEAAAGEPH